MISRDAKRYARALNSITSPKKYSALLKGDAALLEEWRGFGTTPELLDDTLTGPMEEMVSSVQKSLDRTSDGLTWYSVTGKSRVYPSHKLALSIWELMESAGISYGKILDVTCGTGTLWRQCPSPLNFDYRGYEGEDIGLLVCDHLSPEISVSKSFESDPVRDGSYDVSVCLESQAKPYEPDTALGERVKSLAVNSLRDGGYALIVRRELKSTYLRPSLGLTVNGVRGSVSLVSATRFFDPDMEIGPFSGMCDLFILRKDGSSLREVTAYLSAYGNEEEPQEFPSLSSALPKILDDISARPYVSPADTKEYPWLEKAFGVGGRLEGTSYLHDGALYRITDGKPQKLRNSKELHALVLLRDLAFQLIEAETSAPDGDSDLEDIRRRTREMYESYVLKFGSLNRSTVHYGDIDPETGDPKITVRKPPMGGFAKDPTSWTVFSLEKYSVETQESSGADILYRRVNNPHVEREVEIDSVQSALAYCVATHGRVIPDVIGELTGMTGEEATEMLGDEIFFDPMTREWERSNVYLSGNVRAKYRQAAKMASRKPELERNLKALEEALPKALGRGDISVTIGAPYVPVSIVEKFLRTELGCNWARIDKKDNGNWKVDTSYIDLSLRALYTTHRAPFDRIINCAMNSTPPVVYDEEYDPVAGKDRKTKNAQETAAAMEAMERLMERFSTWVWEDEESAETICEVYNENFNVFVPRTPCGDYLQFPDLAPGVELWENQRDFIDQALFSRRSLCAHAVGAGKTLTMVALAVTLRRMGLSQKPMIAVPKHLIHQVSREAQQAFPGKSFLVASSEDVRGARREVFAARCVMGDWDAVICTHEVMTSLPLSPSIRAITVGEELAKLRECKGGYRSKTRATKIAKLEEELIELRTSRDDSTVQFDHLGVDFLAVDEAHRFRNLPLYTNMSGFSMGESQRAVDLSEKLRYLSDRKGRKHGPVCALFTGTPWGNTLAETWVWQTLLQPEVLKYLGSDRFDDWARIFVRFENRIEVSPDGSGFRTKIRPAVVQNVPEMHAMLRTVAHLLPSSAFDRELPDAERETVAIPRSSVVGEFMNELVERAKRLDPFSSSGKSHDNMLLICTDGRKVALDPALVGLSEDRAKIKCLAEEVSRVRKQYLEERMDPDRDARGCLQLVLCDMGTPSGKDENGECTYTRIRQELVKLGVPADRVKFVQDASSDKARDRLFAQCRAGDVDVLIGSTTTVGIGTNIQRRLAAVHHMDAPWKPSDIEQREGRALRPGNLCESVKINTYVVEETFDAFMWDTLTRKARFIAQLFSEGIPEREIDDLSDEVVGFAQVKSIASGNPLLLKQAELAGKIKRLQIKRSAAMSVHNSMRSRIEEAREELDALSRIADKVYAEDARNPSWRTRPMKYWKYAAPSYSDTGPWATMESNGLYAAICFGNTRLRVFRVYAGEKPTNPRKTQKLADRVLEWANEFLTTEKIGDRCKELSAEITKLHAETDNPVYAEDAELHSLLAKYQQVEMEIKDLLESAA